MDKQLSMFELLGMAETPKIPFEEQKKGRKGWVIEISALLLVKNGFKENAVCVKTHGVEFEKDSTKDKYGRISQMARYIKPHDGGWCGFEKEVYATRPTWEECQAFAHKKYTTPQTVKYYERTGNDVEIWDYDKGVSKL